MGDARISEAAGVAPARERITFIVVGTVDAEHPGDFKNLVLAKTPAATRSAVAALAGQVVAGILHVKRVNLFRPQSRADRGQLKNRDQTTEHGYGLVLRPDFDHHVDGHWGLIPKLIDVCLLEKILREIEEL